MSRPLLMNVFFPLCFVARTIPRLVKTGSHNVHPLTLRQHAGFPVELLNVCVCVNTISSDWGNPGKATRHFVSNLTQRAGLGQAMK